MYLPLVDSRQFIQAIRDSGYKGTPSAVSELVDNAFEAQATKVQVAILDDATDPKNDEFTRIVEVLDNGSGMTPGTLHLALQFGGSTRFDSRTGTGRYGMGLPSSSVSQARCVDVFTWTQPGMVWHSYLDVDEVASGGLDGIPKPQRQAYPIESSEAKLSNGTLVRWSRCDRLSAIRQSTLVRGLHRELGRVFRHQIWNGKTISVNGETIRAIDPLFLIPPDGLEESAEPFGEPLEFPISVRNGRPGRPRISVVTARFARLPVAHWTDMNAQDKRRLGISKGAGVSILRAGREIDFGWYFMGNKRKENYDDWWRCEVHFEPDLDEMFGVSHTKQGIRPTEELKDILTPDLETIAHKLNAGIRKTFADHKQVTNTAARRAEAVDPCLPPAKTAPKILRPISAHWSPAKRAKINGLQYHTLSRRLRSDEFFRPVFNNNRLTITINKDHSFYEKLYGQLLSNGDHIESESVRHYLDAILFAAARAETLLDNANERDAAARARQLWGTILEAFLT
ncbi:MAG: ATP-binding protein [Candidatus Thiodiazotropha endolucinida]|nr:ATP-binding protein [Candidatus Thiodiazotropha endolucinida]